MLSQRMVLVFWVLLCGSLLHAQTDSLVVDSAMVGDSLGIDSLELEGLENGLISYIPTSNTPFLKKLQKQLPEIKRKNEKAYLRLHFPWRDDVDVLVPKGFLPAPWTDTPDPDVAWQRSLIFPGLGQVYNRSGWKVPIFYAGYAAVGGWLAFTNSQYSLYQRAFFCSENGCTIPDGANGDGEGLRTQRESWRQRRDQAVLILIAWHGIGAIEAYVDAHLKDFDVSDDLAIKMKPAFIPALSPSIGFGLSLDF